MSWYQKHKVLIIGLWLCTSSAFALSQEAQLLMHQLNDIRSFSAGFNQTITTDRHDVVRSQGQLELLKPNRFKWMIRQPNKQTIVADGHKVWIHDVDLEQVTIKPQAQALRGTPALFLSQDTASIMADYHVQHHQSGHTDNYMLQARSKRPAFSRIQFYFQQGTLSRITLWDRLSQCTDVRFMHIHQNAPLSERVFTMHIPRGTDVITE
jgi:periplasmic chaperone LolA